MPTDFEKFHRELVKKRMMLWLIQIQYCTEINAENNRINKIFKGRYYNAMSVLKFQRDDLYFKIEIIKFEEV